MILLRANQELKLTFDKLIQTMKVPVKWSGIFAVIDNYIILQGEVRSLFFHFDSKKVVTNIIDIPVKEENIEEAGSNVYVRNVINMILYVFGKWGTINGLKVEKNYQQLNRLFTEILREIHVEPEYNQEYFRFYKEGIRVTYEDVVQAALEYEEEKPKEDEEAGGLWHSLVWKRQRTEFTHVDTSLSERLRGRLGSNFYMVGYLCPSCGKKLHMVVYPMGKEFRIETEEGTVLLARAATCDNCNCFYTPRPDRLFSEGDVYTMQFEADRKAYEDYLELMGKRGERVSNNRFNEFADGRRRKAEPDRDEEDLEEFCEDLEEHSAAEVQRMRERMEEGFYPDENIRRLERKIKAYSERENRQEENASNGSPRAGLGIRKMKAVRSGAKLAAANGKAKVSKVAGSDAADRGKIRDDRASRDNRTDRDNRERQNSGADEDTRENRDMKTERGSRLNEDSSTSQNRGESRNRADSDTRDNLGKSAGEAEQRGNTDRESEAVRQKYEAKIAVCDRFSDRQLKEFREQLLHEKRLPSGERQKYLEQVEKRLFQGRLEQLSKKADACEGKPYVVMKRVFDEIEKEELPQSGKQPLLEKLQMWMNAQGEREVQQLMMKMPPNLNRAGYRQFMERIHSYEGINLAPYEERLHDSREKAERREVEELVKRARKITREDYKELVRRLEEGDFLPELILPYREKIDAKLRQMDADEIAEICLNPLELSFEEGMQAYEKIAGGDFLPELKADALRMLSKRLSKIKTDECELLVKKLKEELEDAGIAETPKHHFYPAKKVLLEQALPEETEVIDYALASYAAGKGLFEYPILVVDTSRNGTGKEGMILTPDHLYYSTFLNAYGIAMPSIQKITASTGLLNRGIYVHEKNGTKTKIPYAVSVKELETYAGILNDMVAYLQEKPESRKVDYLAKEKHDTICCFRCGCVYKGGEICPKCGYKNNE